MDNGFYNDIPHSVYHKTPGISSGLLREMTRSPRRAYAQYLQPSPVAKEDTTALQLGRALHCMILTPELFSTEFVVEPDYRQWGQTRNTTGYKQWKESVPKHLSIISQEDRMKGLMMAKAIAEHPKARSMITGGWAETSLFWDDEHGQKNKCRPDYIRPGVIVDYKTTTDATKRAFQRDVFKYGYDQQAAHYLAGAVANGLPVEHFIFVVQEKEPPFSVGIYFLNDDVINRGSGLNQKARQMIFEKDFPEYNAGEVEAIELPAYLQTEDVI